MVKPPERMDFTVEDQRATWKRWRRQFMVWLTSTEQLEKSDVVKINLLLTCLGPDGLEVYDTFDAADDATLEDVLEEFDRYWEPRSNVTMSRYKFFSSEQGSKSVNEFVTSLKSLAKDCEFGDLRDSLVKDMLVLHCSSDDLRGRLLRETDLTLKRATNIALVHEEANRNLGLISSGGGRGASDGEGAALVASWRRRKRSGGSDKIDTGGGDGERFYGVCWVCGKRGHKAAVCKLRHMSASEDRAAGVAIAGGRSRSSSGSDSSGSRPSSSISSRLRHGTSGRAPKLALSASLKGARNDCWLVDSGASCHMTGRREVLANYKSFAKPCSVFVGGGRKLWAYGVGEVYFALRTGVAGHVIDTRLTKTLYVPDLCRNLVSVRAVEKRGYRVDFKNRVCQFFDANGAVCGRANCDPSGLYALDIFG
jgi:hypothetical protein